MTEENTNKMIDLKGASGTMKLGLLLYTAIVVALIVGACHAYQRQSMDGKTGVVSATTRESLFLDFQRCRL